MDIEFLTVEDVRTLHKQQLAAFGGQDGLRDPGLLDSAVAAAKTTFGGEYLHSDLAEMAAAYAFHIAQNQAFIDGNKRTALNAALMFLDLNGIPIEDPKERLRKCIQSFATHETNKHDFAAILRKIT